MITENEKNQALEILEQYESEQAHQIRESVANDCPTKEFEKGEPNGTCYGDGHYLCNNCVNYNNSK